MRFILACRKKYFRAPPFAKKESGSPHRALNAVSVEVVGTIRRRCIARTRVPRSRWNMTPGGFRAVPGPDPGRVRVVSPGVRGPAGRVRQRGARAVVRRARCTWTRWELRGAAPSAIAAKVSLLVVTEIGPLWRALIRRALRRESWMRRSNSARVLIEGPSRFLAVVVCLFFRRRLGGVHTSSRLSHVSGPRRSAIRRFVGLERPSAGVGFAEFRPVFLPGICSDGAETSVCEHRQTGVLDQCPAAHRPDTRAAEPMNRPDRRVKR